MLRKMHIHNDPRDAFIVAAPTYPIMQQATLPTFLEFCGSLGHYHKGDKVFETYWGAYVYFRTSTVGDSVVGIRRTRHVWLDEAGLMPLYFWENIQGRAAPLEASIDITTSPYSLNWVYKELIKPSLKGARDDVLLVQATSKENPYFPDEEYERRKQTMDPRRFKMMFGGDWGRREGIVYDCFDEDENIIEPSELPAKQLRVFAGVDWGYTHQFSVFIFAVDPDTMDHYVISNVSKSRLTLSEIKNLVSSLTKIHKVELWACGPDQPGYIKELNRIPGVTATAAINDILPGITYCYELIKSRKLKLLRGRARYVEDEIEVYHFPEPKDESHDKDEKEPLPVKRDDHAMDAMRYGLVTAQPLIRTREPFTPENLDSSRQSQRARIRQLFRSGQSIARTEKWD